MSVMECSKSDCENILCHKYSTKYGYICDECFEDLFESGELDIQLFMDVSKSYYNRKGDKTARRLWLEEVFKET